MKTRSTLWLAATASLLLLLAACTPAGPANGNLSLAVTPPAGAASGDVKVTVSGPSGSTVVNASKTLSLKPGTYTVSAADLKAGGFSYKGAASPGSVSVQSGKTATSAVTYTATTGKLTVNVSVPAAVTPAPTVTVAGPGSFSQTITGATQTFSDLAPGDYSITATDVGGYKKAISGNGTVTVTAGQEATGSVAYAQAFGSIIVTVTNYPSGATPAAPQITATQTAGTNVGFKTSITGAGTLSNLPVGTYTVSGSDGAVGTVTYSAAPVPNRNLPSDGSTANAALTYVAGARSIAVTVTGLFKAGAKVIVTASGVATPQTTTATADGTASVTFGGLPATDYTVSAQALSAIRTYASASAVSAPLGTDSVSVPVLQKTDGWLFAAGNGKLAGNDNILASLGESLETATPSYVTNAAFSAEPGTTTPAIVRLAFDPADYFYLARQRISSSTSCPGGGSCDSIQVYTPASYTNISNSAGFAPGSGTGFTIVTSYSGQPATISDLAFTTGGDLWVAVQGSTASSAQPSGLLCYSKTAIDQGKASNTTPLPVPNPAASTLVVYQRYYTATDGSLDGVRALSFDAAGNLWVASNTKISRVPVSALTCKNQNDTVGSGDAGDTYAVDNGPETVTPDLKLTTSADVFSLAFDANRNSLWATDYTAGSVFEIPFSGGANATSGVITTGTPFTTGLTKTAGLAVDKQGHVWVGTDNGTSSKVQELIPGVSTLTAGRTIAAPSYAADVSGVTSIAIATKAIP